jgi:DegV family protein with EDD domain
MSVFQRIVAFFSRMFGRRRTVAAPRFDLGARTRVVTDSTASLPPLDDDVAIAAVPLIVPLHVVYDGASMREGLDITPDDVSARLTSGQRLTTSGPSAEDFLAVYSGLAASGARAIVSIHLSGEMSGTASAAAIAAERVGIPVTVVDSKTSAMALGFAAQEAAKCAASGKDAEQVAARAREVAAASTSLFLVDSIDHLRRGGRITAAAAALATALGVRPILTIDDNGIIKSLQRVRTRPAAVARLVKLAAAKVASATTPAIAVHHLASPERALSLAADIEAATGITPVVTPLSAILGVHTGPGTLAVVVSDLGTHAH